MPMLYQFTLPSQPSGSVGIFETGNAIGGSTTAVSQISTILDGINTVIFYASGILSHSEQQRADLSKGMGTLAEAIEGTLEIPDIGYSAAIGAGTLSMIGAVVLFGDYDPTQTPAIYQLQRRIVYDMEASPKGSLILYLRSQIGVSTAILHGARSILEIPTDPIDPTNPTDPTYADNPANRRYTTGYAGRVFGNIPTSIRAGDTAAVQTIARWDATTQRQGDISDPTQIGYGPNMTIGKIAAISGGVFLGPFSSYSPAVAWNCRSTDTTGAGDTAEAQRLVAQIGAFQANGYKVVASNGTWFLDLDSFIPYNGTVMVAKWSLGGIWYYDTFATGGAAFGYHQIQANIPAGTGPFSGLSVTQDIFWINLADIDARELYPDATDFASVTIYAVPAAVPISSAQSVILGFARDETTQTVSGDSLQIDGVQVLFPSCADSGGFLGAQALPNTDIALDDSVFGYSGYHNAVANWVIDTDPVSIMDFGGSTAAINTDLMGAPGTGLWVAMNGVSSTGIVPLTGGFYTWFKAALDSLDADFFCSESSFLVTFSASAAIGSPKTHFRFQHPFDTNGGPPLNYFDYISAPSGSYKLAYSAQRNRTIPRWRSFAHDIPALNSRQKTFFGILVQDVVAANTTYSFTFALTELFLWAFRKYSFSSLYPVLYPGFREDPILGVATGSTAVVVVGAGTLSAAYPVMTDGEYNDATQWIWQNQAIPGGCSCVVIVGTIAYAVGTDLVQAVGTVVLWTSSTLDGTTPVTWTEANTGFASGTTGNPISMVSDGTNLVVGTDTGDVLWSVAGSGIWYGTSYTTQRINAVAWDGAYLLALGGAGVLLGGTTPGGLVTITSPTTANLRGAIFVTISGSKLWIVIADDGVWTSVVATAGTVPATWVHVLATSQIETVSMANGVILVTGSAGNWTSLNGTTWTPFAYDLDQSSPWPALPQCSAVWGTSRILGGAHPGPMLLVQYKNGHIYPLFSASPSQTAHLIAHLIGADVGPNPVQWNGLASWNLPGVALSVAQMGVAFDPPTSGASGTTPAQALQAIFADWWGFGGEMSSAVVDGSSDTMLFSDQGDPIFPQINLGNIEDIATELQVNFHKFAGGYLKTAYILHTNEAFDITKGSGYYFGGWDDPSVVWTSGTYTTAAGYAIWAYCRAAFLAMGGIRRSRSWASDSIHTEQQLGAAWTASDPVLGVRARHICGRPRYMTATVVGNRTPSAYAYCCAVYTHNPALLEAAGITTFPTSGVIVMVDHDYISGTHKIESIYTPL